MMRMADRDLVLENLRKGDPEVEYRIENDTERYRKGFGTIVLKDKEGNDVDSGTVVLKQVSHSFLFGCNMFLLGQFDTADQNAAYEDAFKEVFNLAVVPLYWSDMEPEPGNPRFGKESRAVYRRPPVDQCLEFCEAAGITSKGHPLVWHLFYPDWLPGDPARLRALIERRIREIAERYGERIRLWDVCNEALACGHHQAIRQVGNHLDLAFELARRYLPASSTFTYNETTHNSWGALRNEQTPLYMLLKDLQRRHKLDAVGLQYHLFCHKPEDVEEYRNNLLNPAHLYEVMDWYARLGLPLRISEITLPGYEMVRDGEAFQAELLEKLYRIWFSHPAVQEITWWNLVDGTAAYAPRNTDEGENYFKGGLVNYDISRKQGYEVLNRLINEEWRSDETLDYRMGAPNAFHGYYGDYEVTVRTSSGTITRTIRFVPDGPREFEFTV